MIHYGRERLAIVEIDVPADAIPLSSLELAIATTHMDTVCLELGGRLFGVVSLGDMVRAKTAGASDVRVTRTFTSCEPSSPMRARELFKERPGVSLLPVVDADGRLVGAYSRCDEVLLLECRDDWRTNRDAERYVRQHPRIALVRPCEADERRARLVASWNERLCELGAQTDVIGIDEVRDACASHDLVLFVDDDERRAARALVEAVRGQSFDVTNALSYFDVLRGLSGLACEELVRSLEDSGVRVLMLCQTETGTPYHRRLREAILKRQEGRTLWERAHVMDEDGPGFYEELYTPDYMRAVGRHSFLVERTNSFERLRDCSGPYFNVRGGRRVPVGQLEHAARTVRFFGGCVTVGMYVEDRYTIESQLQGLLVQNGNAVRVENCGRWENVCSELATIASTPMQPGDVAVIHLGNLTFPGIDSRDLMEVMERFDMPARWILDAPVHANHRANGCYAQAVYEWLEREDLLDEPAGAGDACGDDAGAQSAEVLDPELVRRLYLDRYFADYPAPRPGERIGSVCMHADPYTLGHDYLVRQAREQVDRLVVFVIEEELGAFSFAERYAMACAAMKDIPGVRVAPAGPFQATRETFPQYFLEVAPDEMGVGVRRELELYGRCIARPLGITARFFGDEPGSAKMQRFNELAQEILPACGCDAVVIRRKEADGGEISATRSRELAALGEWDGLGHNVPATSLAIMRCE